MKNITHIIFLSLLLFSCKDDEPTPYDKVITYKPTDEFIFNPERGFYKHFDVHSYNYVGLNINTLKSIKQSGISLVYRGFYLENFINSNISNSYLSNMQSDFDKIREAGLKVLIRFAYSIDENVLVKDAPKAVILNHIENLREVLNKNADVIYVVKAGFIGTWGEWHYTSQPEFNFTEDKPSSYLAAKEVVEKLLDVLPDSRMIMLRTPRYKRGMFEKTALDINNAFSKKAEARIGHHNDCFLAAYSDANTYKDEPVEYPYLEKETLFLPMGGETCGPNPPRSECPTALEELKKFHWSFMSLDYHLGVLEAWKRGEGCFNEIHKSLGYRFQLNTFKHPDTLSKAKSLVIEFEVENKGFAALFNERKVYLVLENASNPTKVIRIPLKTDPRFWLGNLKPIVETLNIPKDTENGKYNLYLHLPDHMESLAKRPEYSIRLANEDISFNSAGLNNLNTSIYVKD